MEESDKLIRNEAEAIECLKSNKSTSGYVMLRESIDMAIKALEEVQQYRAIGTPEKCREAVEKQTAKKPMPIDYEKYIDIIDNAKFLRGAFWCPNCRHVVYSGSFCKDCGQKLDWSDEE